MNRSSEIEQQKIVRMRRQFSMMNSTDETMEGVRSEAGKNNWKGNKTNSVHP